MIGSDTYITGGAFITSSDNIVTFISDTFPTIQEPNEESIELDCNRRVLKKRGLSHNHLNSRTLTNKRKIVAKRKESKIGVKRSWQADMYYVVGPINTISQAWFKLLRKDCTFHKCQIL